MKKHPKPEHGSQEWLELRHRIDGRCVIGASEVPALLGHSPYKTRADLFVDKTRPVEVSAPSAAMRRGTILEPALIAFAQEELDAEIIVPDVMFQNDRIIATLDGQVSDAWGIECKTTNSWLDGQPLPIEFILQAQAQMFAAEMERVTFSILDRHLRLSLVEVVRDDAMIIDIHDQARIFSEMIDDGAEFVDAQFTLPQIATLFPEPQGEAELPLLTLSLIEEWHLIKEQMKDLDAREKAIKDQIANDLRDAEFGVINGERVVSFKKQSQSRIDAAKLRRLVDASIVEQAMTTSSFRVMRAMI